jgi:DNA-binding IclR family transcriptional regulator
MEPELDPKNIVGSVIKASRLLEVFSTDQRDVSLGEFTKGAGYNKTTTYRLLQTMVGVGWLVRSSSGGYRLGPRLLVLGAIARADLDLRNESLPYMERLADEFGDTAFLMVPGQHGAVVIETVVGRNPVRVHGLSAGSVLPYHVAAAPVVLAAFSPEIEAAVLAGERQRFTAQSMTTKAALRAKLADVRNRGYSVSMEDYIPDVGAIAAPVMGPDGRAVAALSVGGPANRFADAVREQTIARVVELAAELSSRMNA